MGLFERVSRHQGPALDVLMFLLNLWAMHVLAEKFLALLLRAGQDDPAAHFALFAFAMALFVLAPIGARLRRWHDRDANRDSKVLDGCLFSPILYFCLTAVVFAAANSYVLQQVYGKREPDAAVFVGSILGGMVLMIVHTWLVYSYFSPPKSPPKFAFMRSQVAASLGGICLTANMIGFQLIWNLLGTGNFGRPGSVGEAVGRLLGLVFLALLVYFPPRVFTLSQDIKNPWAWATILLANSPVIVRVMFGI